MLSRLATHEEAARAQRACWPELRVVPVAETSSEEFDDARQALSEALEQAAALRERIDELERDAEARERLSFEKGLAEGRNSGKADAVAAQKPVLERMSRAIAELAMMRPKLRMQAEGDLLNLCIGIAKRVLRHELHMDPLALEGIVRAALEHTGTAEVFKVRVHPKQAEAVRSQLSKLGVPESVIVEAVASLDEGDVLVETSAGTIDASMKTQISEVERGLATRLGA
jgi:flagellar assembly protein FliH